MYRVLFHLDESASCKVEQVVSNIRHLMDELDSQGLSVEVVAHSDGINALQRENPQARSLAELAKRGVRLAACHNTMVSRGIEEADILPEAQVVPSGIGELVRRETEGWVYVRP